MLPRRRLNLFAFPTETDALFNLLILSSITLAQFFGNALVVIFGDWNTLASVDITTRGIDVTTSFLPFIGLSVTLILAVLGIAYFFYLRHPAEIRKHRGISSISEKDQAIQEQVNELSFQAAIEPPEIEMPPQGLRGTDAQAFGVGKAQKIGLDGGFRILRKTKPDIFNALLHHELAHFANEDIGRSYFSYALWKSLRWVIVLPFVLGLIGNFATGFFINVFSGDLQAFLGFATQFLFPILTQLSFVLAVAAMLWARLLRAREFYADWRAVLWGSQNGLKNILEEAVETEKPRLYLSLLKFHPNAQDRIDAIEHPENLFKLSPMIVFLAGIVLSFLFFGIYLSFAALLAFAGVLQEIRDSSTGLFYWLARGLLWFGIIMLLVLVFGSIAWLMNSVLLPQIHKQATFDLVNQQRGWAPYTKLLMASVVLVAGIELGFFMTPFGQFSPSDLWGVVLEIFIIAPILVLIVWWYLACVRYISLRLTATQIGKDFSILRKWFLRTVSGLWVFFFVIPGLFLSRFLSGELLEVFLYASVIWLIFTILLSLAVFGGSWAIIKFVFENGTKNCPHCGKVAGYTSPAIESCKHCEGVLGEWLFVPEKI